MLAQRYGQSVQISLEQYPVPSWKQSLAQVVSMLKFFLLYVAASQFNPLVSFGFMSENDPVPEFLLRLKENKIYSCLMIFFISNAIEGSLISSGAFEIYANDNLIASKLESGQVPNPQNVMRTIDELLGKQPGSDGFSERFH